MGSEMFFLEWVSKDPHFYADSKLNLKKLLAQNLKLSGLHGLWTSENLFK
jgi:hypothetical protein